MRLEFSTHHRGEKDFMNRRQFISLSLVYGTGLLAGCRGNQFGRVKTPGEQDMVGSHAAGA